MLVALLVWNYRKNKKQKGKTPMKSKKKAGIILLCCYLAVGGVFFAVKKLKGKA